MHTKALDEFMLSYAAKSVSEDCQYVKQLSPLPSDKFKTVPISSSDR